VLWEAGGVLWSMAFDQVGVVVGDIFFADPASQGDDDVERGVRLELRRFVRDELHGSVYSAVPIRVAEPIWRVDLLEQVSSPPGSLDRAHHHPRFRGWEPGRRVFVEELSADPVGWLRKRFADVPGVLADAGIDAADLGPNDVADLEAAGPMIVDAVERLLVEVAAGRAGLAPDGAGEFVRASWL
jgi:hypothetical protein